MAAVKNVLVDVTLPAIVSPDCQDIAAAITIRGVKVGDLIVCSPISTATDIDSMAFIAFATADNSVMVREVSPGTVYSGAVVPFNFLIFAQNDLCS